MVGVEICLPGVRRLDAVVAGIAQHVAVGIDLGRVERLVAIVAVVGPVVGVEVTRGIGRTGGVRRRPQHPLETQNALPRVVADLHFRLHDIGRPGEIGALDAKLHQARGDDRPRHPGALTLVHAGIGIAQELPCRNFDA